MKQVLSNQDQEQARATSPRWRWWRALGALVIAGFAIWMLVLGWQLREWTWRSTEPIRWNNIDNAWRWGREVQQNPAPAKSFRELMANCFTLYDHVEGKQAARDALDYPPLRLTIASLWVHFITSRDPDAIAYEPQNAWPMLGFNTFCTLAAAVAGLLLVHHWAIRRQLAPEPSGWARLAWWRRTPPQITASGVAAQCASVTGWIAATVAALLIWFNPAAILESHGWAQWDIWPVPFFLWAALLASRNWWAAAGALLVIGAMLKGQMLLVVPVFVLWPIFQGKPGAVARLVIGFAAAGMLIISGWMLRGGTAWAIVGVCTVAPIVLVALWRRWRRPEQRGSRWMFGWAGAFGLAMGILLAALLTEPSMAWYRVGLLTGTTKFEAMARNSACNLPAILGERFGWRLRDPVGQWFGQTIVMKQLLAMLYGATLLMCGWGVARHVRRNDPRAVIALCAPWILMFTLMGMMDGRYLLYGACTSAVFVAAGWRYLLVPVVLTAMNFAFMLKFLTKSKQHVWPEVQPLLRAIEPDIGWMLIVIAGVVLYVSLTPTLGRKGETRGELIA